MDAIGLLHFIGCFLSFSMSKMSLIMYSLPESMQKKMNAGITSSHIWKFRMFSEKTMPTSIKMFLYHCFGRIVLIRAFIAVPILLLLISPKQLTPFRFHKLMYSPYECLQILPRPLPIFSFHHPLMIFYIFYTSTDVYDLCP